MASIKKLLRYPIIRWGMAIIWTIFLSVILLQPEQQPIIPTGVQPAPPSLKREIIFTSLHLITFTLTACLWCFALRVDRSSRRKILLLGMTLLAYGLTVEYLQSTVPGRTAQWWDMLANCIGIMSGYFLWQCLQYQAALKRNAPNLQLFG